MWHLIKYSLILILQSSFFVFWGKEKSSALSQGNGDRLSARRWEDSSSLPAHSYGAAVRRDLDAEGTHKPVCPYLPILWMKNLRTKKGRDLPEIRVLGLPELFFFFFFFLNTSLRVSSQSWGEWLHEWSRSSMPEKARTSPPALHMCVPQWVNHISLYELPTRGVSMKYKQVFLPVVKT